MRPLVIVRPEPGASATAKAAAAMGLEPMLMPLFEVRAMPWRAPDPKRYDGLLLTSANAVRHGGSELDTLKSLAAYCVGEATAACAREAGFAIGETGHGGIEELLATLSPGLRLLHLCGAVRKDPADAKQSIEPLPVYESVELANPLGEIAGAVVALHSPRAASAFARQAEALDKSKVAIVAISAATAVAAGDGWEQVEAAPEPTDSALLAIASRLCNKCG